MLAIFVKSEYTHDRTPPRYMALDPYQKPSKIFPTSNMFHRIFPTTLLLTRRSSDKNTSQRIRVPNADSMPLSIIQCWCKMS